MNHISPSKVLELAQQQTRGWRMLIGREWVESRSGKRYTTYDPSRDAPLAEVPEANAADVDAAVAAAKAAFPAWSRLHVDERAKMLLRLADAVRARESGFISLRPPPVLPLNHPHLESAVDRLPPSLA
jgi:betaine-aldehyde dehydrogenase